MNIGIFAFLIAALSIAPVFAEEFLKLTTAAEFAGDAVVTNDGRTIYDSDVLVLKPQVKLSNTINQGIYFKFDLSPLDQYRVLSASLVLQPLFTYDRRYVFDVYGINNERIRSNINSVVRNATITKKRIEDQIPDLPHPELEINDYYVNLGQIHTRPKNNQTTLSGDTLVDYLNEGDGFFLLTLAPQQILNSAIYYSSEEHRLFSAPAIWINAEKRSDFEACVGPLLHRKVEYNDVETTLDLFYFRCEITAQSSGWLDCLEDAKDFAKMLNGKYGDDLPESSTRLMASLAEMMQHEIAFRCSHLSEEEWARNLTEIISRHSRRTDALIYAFYIIAGNRIQYQPTKSLSLLDFRPLLNYELSPLAYRTISEFIVDVSDGPKDGFNRLPHYRGLIPIAHGKPTTPYIIYQYVKELENVKGIDAVLVFLDQAAARKPDEPIGQAACILRIAYEPDPSRKAALVARFMETGKGEIVEALLPYYLTNQARNGRLLAALIKINPALHEHRLTKTEAWGQAVVNNIYETLDSSNRVKLLPSMVSANLNLGELVDASELCTDLARQFFEEGNYLDAAAVAWGVINNEDTSVYGLQAAHSPETLADIMSEDTQPNRRAVAALLLHLAYKQIHQSALSRKYLRDSGLTSATGQTQTYVLLFQILAACEQGEIEKAKGLLDQALKLAPHSPTLIEISDLLKVTEES